MDVQTPVHKWICEDAECPVIYHDTARSRLYERASLHIAEAHGGELDHPPVPINDDSLRCPFPKCNGTMRLTRFTSWVLGDKGGVPEWLASHTQTSTWEVSCFNGHILLLPDDDESYGVSHVNFGHSDLARLKDTVDKMRSVFDPDRTENSQ